MKIHEIMEDFEERNNNHEPISPGEWLNAATTITVLMKGLDEQIVAANSECNKLKAKLVEEGKSVAMAKVLAEASKEFEILSLLKAEKVRADEFVMLAKKRTQLQNYDF